MQSDVVDDQPADALVAPFIHRKVDPSTFTRSDRVVHLHVRAIVQFKALELNLGRLGVDSFVMSAIVNENTRSAHSSKRSVPISSRCISSFHAWAHAASFSIWKSIRSGSG